MDNLHTTRIESHSQDQTYLYNYYILLIDYALITKYKYYIHNLL